jgi:hypothetical protein
LITIADALGYHEFGVTGWSEANSNAKREMRIFGDCGDPL